MATHHCHSTEIHREGFSREKLLFLFFQRNDFLYHVDSHTRFIFITYHNLRRINNFSDYTFAPVGRTAHPVMVLSRVALRLPWTKDLLSCRLETADGVTHRDD